MTSSIPAAREPVGRGSALLLAAAIAVLAAGAPRAQGDQPPTVIAKSPPANASGVSPNINVTAIFSEPIQPATLSFVLRNSLNEVMSSQVAYDNGTSTATLNPNGALAGSQTFTATVSGARDLAGNQMGQVNWSFTTSTDGFQDNVLPQIGMTNPTVIQFASNGNVFVAEKSGRIFRFNNLNDSSPETVADLRESVYNYWDRGLLGMALDPNFPANPYIYVLYTYDALPGGGAPQWGTGALGDDCPNPPGANTNGCVVTGRLSRLNINQGSWPLGPGDEEVLVTDWFNQFPSHTVGSLIFGPDGALYASGGDGANFDYADYGQTSSDPGANDPPNEGGALRSQDLRTSGDTVTLDGTIIRVSPSTGDALPGNPLYGSGDPNTRRIVNFRSAQSLPRHVPPRDERVVGRRRRLADLGGDQPHRRSARLDRRELRLAVLRRQ